MRGSNRDYKGVVQVHTDLDGGVSLGSIVEAAKVCRLDFVVVTDCIRDEGVDLPRGGWNDGVLVLHGEEVRTAEGRFLAFETREPIVSREDLTLEEALGRVRDQHGIVVGLDYQYLDLPTRPSFLSPPLEPPSADVLGVWSFLDEFTMRARGVGALQFHARPERILRGPSKGAGRLWDGALRGADCPALACVNAFNRKEPLLEWREYFPFKSSFRTLCTVVQTRELPRVDGLACDFVWEALRLGRSYMANQSLGDPRGFRFSYQYPAGPESYIGETAEFAKGGYVEVTLPAEAEVVLRHNGLPLFWGTGSSLRFPIPFPGVLRIEVRRERKVWILSNAIRVFELDDHPRREATVIDFT